jgi:acyl-coenzyme A synthetase/AMP-(fatty) acid ligase
MTQSNALPLLVHAAHSAPIAYRRGAVLSVAQYLADVRHCAQCLPQSPYVLIACQDRYAFAVGFAAALLRQQICLLPSTHTEELIAKLATAYPGVYCLRDEAPCDITLPQTDISTWLLQAVPTSHQNVPCIAADQVAAIVFTSGSTGLPVPHCKTWGKLTINVKSEGQRLGVVPGRSYTIVGTVPPQHMYGFESTVLIALQNAAAFEAGKPFYPTDIENALQHVPRPRALVTTPFHLRAWLSEVQKTTALDLVVSATAPLAIGLAQQAEQTTAAPLFEIYGSTETSQLATRRTTQTEQWTVFDGIRLQMIDGQHYASGAQIEGVVPINDVLQLQSEQIFSLQGRTVDMVNIAGKSTTLSYLNHQLLSIPGVVDGTFLLPDQNTEGIGNTTRLAAVIVAPGMNALALQAELRQRIAPAFLPRPLKFVDKLPRNATGKLPREALLSLLKKSMGV